jgi:peptide/nickel transport system ATP-binding protein/oligopeptide transport system ATP-binding protein
MRGDAMSVALEAEGLVKHFPVRTGLFGRATAHVRAVDGVSFEVQAGRTFAIVGESGCGKSTVARLLLRLIEPDAGRVTLGGEDLLAADAASLRRLRGRIQLVFQDPYGSLNPRMTAGAMLAEPLLLHGSGAPAERTARVAELLSQVGLRADAARRYPHEFSGGQRQRLAIARALAAGPKVIVCDEPVSALDVSIQAQILNLLGDLQRSLGLAYVFISHDLAVVRQIATDLGVMYLGRLVETGPAPAVFGAPRHPYTRALLSAVPIPDPAARGREPAIGGDVPSPLDPPPGCTFHTRCPHADERCRTESPALEAAGDGVSVACWHWKTIAPPASTRARATRPDDALARLQAAFVR